MKLSLKYTMGLVLLCCAVLPVYFAGQLILNKQSETLLEQKVINLNNSTQGITQTVASQVDLTLRLTEWYAQDRSLLKAGSNVFFSSVVWEKMASFNELADGVSATYILDKSWRPIYDSKGSLYHFENSQLLSEIKRPKSTYVKGKIFHSEFAEPSLANDSESGIAIVAPILPYRLVEGSEYSPQGYLVVLMGYDLLKSKVAPFLYDKESVEFHYAHSADLNSGNDHEHVVKIANPLFLDPLSIEVKHNVSDEARQQEMQQAQVVFIRILFATFLLAVLFALVLNHWFSRQLNLLLESVESYSKEKLPTIKPEQHKFTEFYAFSVLLDKMWQRIGDQLDELTIRNDKLKSAYQQIKVNNAQLENFNVQLEQTVEEKTYRLTHSLQREADQKRNIMRIVEFASMRQGVEYRLIPNLVETQLAALLLGKSIQFSFTKPTLDVSNTNRVQSLLDSKGQVIGYFNHSSEYLTLSDEDQLIFDLYQKQLAAWIELENMTRVDLASGCFNRKAFDDDLSYCQRKVIEKDWVLSLLVIDVNGLKQTNDVHGHQAGDRLIKACVDIVQERLQSHSNMYRLGGDEFAVLTLTPSAMPEVEALKEQLYSDQTQSHILIKGHPIPVLFSVGFSQSDSSALNDMFSHADQDMYTEKRRFYEAQDES